ncbi:hypothetical protein DMB95_00120 [Campylobacter sp. MIT 12-8780]|nr:hypothetical protein DMB95_00120 [Campylobacter sp. MIT 12-8780]
MYPKGYPTLFFAYATASRGFAKSPLSGVPQLFLYPVAFGLGLLACPAQVASTFSFFLIFTND